MAKKLFIAATGQHKGKTTCTLGLCASLKAAGYDVGYCKPVGQKHLTIDGQIADKDAVLFAQLLDFKIDSKIHSPVVIASGVTTQFIDEPDKYDFRQDLEYADEALCKKHEIVVYEGTGHPGVGSIVNFSNPRVAKLLGADVVLVVEGGIGKTIDNMNLSRALFEKHGLELKGVIVNKVHPDKIERVETYITKKLKEYNIPVLGVIPYDRTLSNPILSTVCMAVRGKVLVNQHKLWNQVEEILAGTFIEVDEFTYLKNVLLITSIRRFHAAMAKIKEGIKERELDECPITGVIITGDGRKDTWYRAQDLQDDYLIENEVPVITTMFDNYDTVVAISKIEVKINTHTPWKVKRAIEMVKEHVDFEALLGDGSQQESS